MACYNRGLRFSLCTMELSTWLAFFAASWAISISPGAGAVAAMSAGLNHGFRRGYITTIGLVLGIWTQILVVGVGLGAVVAASGTAFLVIKWAGVAYLVWLAWRLGLSGWLAKLLKSLDALQLPTHRGVIRFDSEKFIREVSRHGTELHFWTINDPMLARVLRARGAQGIVSDRIDDIIVALAE